MLLKPWPAHVTSLLKSVGWSLLPQEQTPDFELGCEVLPGLCTTPPLPRSSPGTRDYVLSLHLGDCSLHLKSFAPDVRTAPALAFEFLFQCLHLRKDHWLPHLQLQPAPSLPPALPSPSSRLYNSRIHYA